MEALARARRRQRRREFLATLAIAVALVALMGAMLILFPMPEILE